MYDISFKFMIVKFLILRVGSSTEFAQFLLVNGIKTFPITVETKTIFVVERTAS